MDDYISRQMAINMLDEQIELCEKALYNWLPEKDRYAVKVEKASLTTYREKLKYLPSAQPKQRWIPCSERLPEEENDVLVTRTFLGCKDGSHGWNNHIPPTTYVEVAQYFNGEWTALSDEYKIARNRHTNPIAWMSLPEPYQEGEQE